VRHRCNIAPRVALYPFGSAPPVLEEGWIALAQLPVQPGCPTVFGDGSHATTRLCATAVDLLCRQRRMEAVLDVGTGTGVLARIARARGTRFICGTDIDPVAVHSARTHASLDRHPVEIQFGCNPPDWWGAHFDLVVVNILESPLHELMPALCRALLPAGILLISGFTRPQIPGLRVRYERGGLDFRGSFQLGDWALLKFAAPKAATQHETA
jgi:ribosomal protein L11 methyltransferase